MSGNGTLTNAVYKQKQTEKYLESTEDVRSVKLVSFLLSITQRFCISYAINWSFLLIASWLNKNCRKQAKKVFLCRLNYARRSCRRIQISRNALFSPNCAALHCDAWWTNQTARSVVFQSPEIVYESPQRPPMLLLWCVIFENRRRGPYFLEDDSATEDMKEKVLPYDVILKNDNYTLDMILQQNGAPLY